MIKVRCLSAELCKIKMIRQVLQSNTNGIRAICIKPLRVFSVKVAKKKKIMVNHLVEICLKFLKKMLPRLRGGDSSSQQINFGGGRKVSFPPTVVLDQGPPNQIFVFQRVDSTKRYKRLRLSCYGLFGTVPGIQVML